jgi:hypothetical protein
MHPPTKPSGGTPATTPHNFAVRTLYLGTDRNGTPDLNNAWKSYGFDLDGRVTTAQSTDVCTLYQNPKDKSAQIDGNDGIDNSFGENIWPQLAQIISNAETTINQSIQAGHFTVMTYVTGFDGTPGSMASATGLTGLLLAGGNYANLHDGGAPSWDLSTHWPISPSLLNGCTPAGGCPAGTDPLTSASIQFNSAYQAGGTFVNGAPTNVSLTLSIAGQSLAINIQSALITFQPTAGGVTNGTIAGTIVANDLVTQIQAVAGSLSVLCSPTVLNSVTNLILSAADIVIDSSGNVSNMAGVPCNGISVGIGFDATEIAVPVADDILPGSPQAAVGCDAGTD